MPTSSAKSNAPRRRVTLDSQLLTYWEREALRLDALSAAASWGWVARSYARKAEHARAQAARSAGREAARGHPAGTAPLGSENADGVPTV